MEIPANHLVKANHSDDISPLMLDAVENYLRIKGNDDRIFIRTAQRNGNYVAKLLGNRPITSYSTSEAAQFRDWCLDKGMNINSVKRVFASVRSIINLNIRVQAECKKLNDEPKLLIALISDTGLRLSGACGLLVSDIHLDTTEPYIDLVEHPWRRLKTGQSKRQILCWAFLYGQLGKSVASVLTPPFRNTAEQMYVTLILRAMH